MEFIRKTAKGKRWETVEIEILHHDGTVRTVLWNSATIFDSDGKIPIATIAQGHDITERKKAEESIKQSAEEWRNLFNSIPDYILVLDKDNIITRANFRFAEAYNISPEKLIGKKCYEFFHKSDIAKDKLEQVFEPFYTTRVQGLGMGLPICQSILEAHGGRIWAENNPDGGARFCFSLPAAGK